MNFTTIIDHFNQKPTQLLYHYATQQGLLGIMKSKCLWASSIHFLNDSLEFKHAFELLRDEINTRLSDAEELEKAFLNSVLSSFTSTSYLNIFVCSFSEEGDLLSQWRAYSANGTGYSLGIHYNDLSSLIQGQNFKLVKCIYDINDQKVIIRNLLRNAVLNYVENRKTNISATINIHLAYFLEDFLRIAPILKHDSYYEEQEWRLISPQISLDNSEVDFREGKSTIVPYFKFRLAKETENLKLRKLIVGPNPQKWDATIPVAYLITKNKIENCSVGLSRIPYRGW